MSFILDALKKSENARQETAPAEFAGVPSSPGDTRTPGWLWLLAALLAVNAVVLAGFLLRSDTPPAVPASLPSASTPGTVPARTSTPEPAAVATTPDTAPATFADRVARARADQQARAASGPETDAGSPSAATTANVATAAVDAPPVAAAGAVAPARSPFLPSIDELRMRGATSLPDLHVDIHVYSDTPADRFVFINMNKYRESDQLSEGPIVTEITPDGVVLEHRGTAFLLPRE